MRLLYSQVKTDTSDVFKSSFVHVYVFLEDPAWKGGPHWENTYYYGGRLEDYNIIQSGGLTHMMFQKHLCACQCIFGGPSMEGWTPLGEYI